MSPTCDPRARRRRDERRERGTGTFLSAHKIWVFAVVGVLLGLSWAAAFYFPMVGRDRAILTLHWGGTMIPIPVALN